MPVPVPITAGIPYSRATIAACDPSPPESTTTAAARWDSGVHDGLVYGQTSTSPERIVPNSAGERTTRTGPVVRPPLAGTPVVSASASSAAGGRRVAAAIL